MKLQICDTLKRCTLGRHIGNSVIFVVLLVAVFLLSASLFLVLQEPLQAVGLFIFRQDYDIPIIAREHYWVLSIVASVAVAVYINYLCIHYKIFYRLPVKRDFAHLQRLLYSKSKRAPASSLDDLVQKIAGSVEDSTKNTVRDVTASDRDKVANLLSGPLVDYKTIVIRGDWGVGKTSIMMLALEQIESQPPSRTERRYIYEQAFLYAGTLDRFKEAILNALKDVLAEQGIYAGRVIFQIIDNLQKDYLKGFSSLLRANREFNITSDLIQTLNAQYNQKRLIRSDSKLADFEIDIIVDDIDRLPGPALLEAISFISILNQLKFVRLIVPADLRAVNKQIGSEIKYRPEIFLTKYLPEQVSTEVRSTYYIAEQIALEKLRSKCQDGLPETFCPGWAAVLFKLISVKVNDKTRDWSYNFKWTNSYTAEPPEYSDRLTLALRRRYLSVQRQLSVSPLSLRHISDGRNFGSYITSTTLNDGETKIKDVFSSEYYIRCATWVFDFARDCWSFLGISIRDVVDALAVLDGLELSSKDDDAAQFAKVFNKLSDEQIIKLSLEN